MRKHTDVQSAKLRARISRLSRSGSPASSIANITKVSIRWVNKVLEENMTLIDRINRVNEAYDKNFDKMCNATGLQKRALQKRERKLTRLESVLRRRVGNFSCDPCCIQVNRPHACADCTGFFKRIDGKNIMTKHNVGHECRLKHCFDDIHL